MFCGSWTCATPTAMPRCRCRSCSGALCMVGAARRCQAGVGRARQQRPCCYTGSADEVRARRSPASHFTRHYLRWEATGGRPLLASHGRRRSLSLCLDDGGAGVADDMCRGRVHAVSTPTVTLGAYFLFGVYAYGRLEGWGRLTRSLFMTTTTTVGYGTSLRTLGGRLFTRAYCLVGITAVMGALLPPANYLPERRHAFEHYVARLLQRVERHEEAAARAVDQTTADDASQEQQQPSSAVTLPGGAGARAPRRVLNDPRRSSSTRARPPRRSHASPAHITRLYAKAMVGPFTIALFGMALSMLLDGTGPIDGFYWSVITMTTIGFGDIAPTSAQGRLAVVFLPAAGGDGDGGRGGGGRSDRHTPADPRGGVR